jgi:hypothetical protein
MCIANYMGVYRSRVLRIGTQVIQRFSERLRDALGTT